MGVQMEEERKEVKKDENLKPSLFDMNDFLKGITHKHSIILPILEDQNGF